MHKHVETRYTPVRPRKEAPGMVTCSRDFASIAHPADGAAPPDRPAAHARPAQARFLAFLGLLSAASIAFVCWQLHRWLAL
jgi:hypothetical protein